MLTAKINIQPFRHVTDALGSAMGLSRAFANALSIYATGVSQAHVTAFDTMRPSSDDLRLQDLQSDYANGAGENHTDKKGTH
jgi:hypothetical protein